MEPEHVWHRPDVDMKYLCFFLISMLLLSCSRQKRAETLFRGIQSDDYISESFHEVAVSAGKNITIHAGEFDSEGYCLMHELFDTVIAVRLETTEESLVGVVDKVIVVDSCMYVLDKFKTKSVKRFTLEGKYLNVIGQYGEGPEMQREVTDFCISENEVLILDQFQSKIFIYTLDGILKDIRQLPFSCIQLHRFSTNNYVFFGINAFNYHFPEILNYSLWQTDSCFKVNNRLAYKEKEKYQNILERNSLASFSDTLYYKKTWSDTIFSISPEGKMKYEYIIDLNGKAVPQELIRKGNENIWPREIEEGKYVIIDTYAITSDYIYASCVLKNLNYHLFYHIASKKTIMRPLLLNSINSIFPFTRPIVGATEQYLVGAIDAAFIYDSFHERTEQEWLEKKGYCKGKVTNIGGNLIPFCKDLKMDDNPIILLYYFKK